MKQYWPLTVRICALIATLAMLLAGASYLVENKGPLDLAYLYLLPVSSCATDTASCKDLLNTYFILMLSALAFAIPFKVGFFNVGVEGQSLGGSTLVFVVLYFAGDGVAHGGSLLGSLLAVGLACGGGVLGGAVPFLLWRNFGINGVVSTLISNLFITVAVAGGLSGAGLMDQHNPGVQSISLQSSLLKQLSHETFHGLIEAPVFFLLLVGIIGAIWLFWQTRIGLFGDAIGHNERAAKVIGLDVVRISRLAVFTGFALGGVVGLLYTLENGRVTLDYFRNIGFEGIGVAVFGGYRPVGMIIAGFLIALWRIFGNELQIIGLPAELTLIGFGMFILFALIIELGLSKWKP